ncbi:MAG: hypothetical protein SGILL_008450, partial [Bacillariaceae sp.]
ETIEGSPQSLNQRRSQQTILLGPRFDHSWSVDLTMNPLTTVRFDVYEPYYYVSTDSLTPPTDVTIFNGGAGTSLTLNYTAHRTTLELVDQTLDATLYVQQTVEDNPVFGSAANANNVSTSSSRQSSTNNEKAAAATRILTVGSNTLATFVRGNYQDNYATTTSTSEKRDFSTQIALDGFQQKVTIAGIMDDESKDNNDDHLEVKGLAIELFTTADCDDVEGFHFETPINLDDLNEFEFLGEDRSNFLFDDVEEWISRRARHVNYCYEFSMQQFREAEIIPGLPLSVNRTEFFGNITAQGPAADSSDIVNKTVNATNESEFSQSTLPLGPVVRPLPCHSDTTLQNVECVYSGGVSLEAVGYSAIMTTMLLTFAIFV